MIIDPDAYVDGPRTRDALSDAWAWARRDLRDLLTVPSLDPFLVMVGVPCSGKSTWALDHDADELVIFDACNADVSRRLHLAAQIRRAAKTPIAVHVATPIDIVWDRNAMRTAERHIPETVLRRIAIALTTRPPTVHEGWTDVRRVRHFDRRITEGVAKDRGQTFYRWRTKQDDRVRPEHRARHGRLFSWVYAPEGGHPGEDYGCRCWAESVHDDDVVETREGDLRARPLTIPKWARQRVR